MNSVQVSRTQFSSQLSGSGLIAPPIRVTFTISGTISGGVQTQSITVPVPGGYKYFSDAQYTLLGTPGYTPSTIWKMQPRSFNLIDEPTSPIPRVYLNKINQLTSVEVKLLLTNLGGGTFTLSRTYQVHVHLFLFTSNLTY